MFTYSVLEASEKLGISIRGVQKRCQRDDVRKKDNKFLITDSIIEKWKKERQSSVTNVTAKIGTRNSTQDVTRNVAKEVADLNKKVNILTLENEDLKADIQQRKSQLDLEVESLKTATNFKTENIQKLKLDDIENTDFKFQRDGEFIKEGNLVFVPKDKVFAEYSEAEYSEAEQKLNEWATMQQTIVLNEKVFDAKLSSANEIKDHYKSQFEYQKKQSEKMLDLHQRLIDNLHQRNFIEAKEKGFDKK